MLPEKSLKPGTVVKGEKHSYTVEGLLRCDGQGFLYKAYTMVGTGVHQRKTYVAMREYMLVRCSSRGEDGMKIVTPDDIAPTVESCLAAFTYASRERCALSAECPWLINVVETFAANDTYYYIAEYLGGQSLREFVEANGPLDVGQCRRVLGPVFDALRKLHSRHVLHTDVHPGHIRFQTTHKGTIPVLFSLYSTLHFSDKGLQTWTLPVMNCEEGFAPPEQYGSIDHFYPQIDVYALAATLVYALSGKVLPDSRTVTEDVVRATLPPSLPETLVSAIIGALNPDVAMRTSSVTNFREDLRVFFREYDNDMAVRSVDDDDEAPAGTSSGMLAGVKRTAARLKSIFIKSKNA